MSQVLDLLTLQGIDDEAAALNTALAEVDRRLHGDEELNQARAVFADAQESLAEQQRVQRRLDGEVQALTARIVPEEKRLYDGSVKNPKELASIQHELENLKGALSALEDELLEVLAAVEAAETDRAAALASVESHEMRRAGDVQALKRESSRLNEALAASAAKRTAQARSIEGRTLALYDDLRRRKGGTAVAKIHGSSCSGCRVSLPDAVRRRAVVQLVQCPNCERILALG